MSNLVESSISKDSKILKLEAKLAGLATEIKRLKARVRVLENKSGVHVSQSEGDGESGDDQVCIVS